MIPTGVEQSGVFTAIWWVVAAMGVIAAILVVSLKDLLRAALALVVCFLAVAALFVMLNAEFLAVVQVLIYVGAIAILIIFAILLTRDMKQGNVPNRLRVPAILLSALVLGIVVFVAVDTKWDLLEKAPLAPATQEAATDVLSNSVQGLAGLLLRDYALPFEVASLVLLAAIIGAIVMVRER